ncbi:hypothetical protein L2E82_32216 [Cichorium intybus]|uniref:Uncharacterized protein n=1 Tax=Cichorium intybus TaxID=13427 RepID=A0ACB9BJ03_CICIN|nr:hypothetical protein L2E82_32216 [Cichorium intybus]
MCIRSVVMKCRKDKKDNELGESKRILLQKSFKRRLPIAIEIDGPIEVVVAGINGGRGCVFTNKEHQEFDGFSTRTKPPFCHEVKDPAPPVFIFRILVLDCRVFDLGFFITIEFNHSSMELIRVI